MAETSFDLIVLGGGPGGYVAAIRAAQLGMKTAVVERDHLGGICLNWGCIPTKALLRSSEIYDICCIISIEYGFSATDIRFDAGKVVARSRAVAKQLSNGVAYLAAQEQGRRVRRAGPSGRKGRLAVERTASRSPNSPPSTSSWRPGRGRGHCRDSNPTASACGPIRKRWCRRRSRNRCWSSARARSGSNSRAFTATWAPKLRWSRCSTGCLPVEDEEISAFARKSFEKQGIKIHTGATVEGAGARRRASHRADRRRRKDA